jgi:Domain of unknown function (DUF4352)
MQQPPDPYQQNPQQQWQQPPMPPQQQWNPQQPPMLPQQYQQPPQYPPQVPPPKKRGIGKFFAIGCGSLVALVILVIVLAAVVSGGHTSSSSNSSSPIGTTTSDSQNPSGNTVAKVGQTITLDGVQATLVSAKTNQGTDVDIPKAGNEYIVVHVRLHNTTGTEVDYNVFDFHTKSGTGNITDASLVFFVNSSDQLNSGKLAAGGRVEGDIVFEVKKGDHQAELTWQPSFFQNAGDNGWTLGL